MRRIRHTIKRKNIPEVKLVSLTDRTWYDYDGNLVSWDELIVGPTTGYTIFNVTGGTVSSGYYIWGTPTNEEWNSITKEVAYGDYQLPVQLDAKSDEYGPMVDFDGNINYDKIVANFSYSGVCYFSGYTVTFSNTTDFGKLKGLESSAVYTLTFHDGTTSGLTSNGSIIKNYPTNGSYNVTINLDTPWTKEKLSKNIVVDCNVLITPTPTVTPTKSLTPTPTPTITNTASLTVTPTITKTPTVTPTNTATPTVTPTITNTATNTPTPTNTITNTVTPTKTPTNTPTPTQTINCLFGISANVITPTPTPTISVTPSITPSASVTVTPTPTQTINCSFGISVSLVTPTPTSTITPTPTITPTLTPTPTNTITPTPTQTINCSFGISASLVTPTPTPTNTTTPTPTATQTQTPTNTVTPTPTQTINCSFGISANIITPTPTPTVTSNPTSTPTATPTSTPTVTPTVTSTNTATPTSTPTVTPTVTPTNTVTPTPTPTQTINCLFGISANVVTPTPTVTNTPTNTITPTLTPTPTNTVTPTLTPTATPTTTPTLDTSFTGTIEEFFPISAPTGCTNCGGYVVNDYTENNFKTDIECLDLSNASDGDIIYINYSANDRPNRFAVKENNLSIVANSGWVGSFGGNPYVAPYSGPWGTSEYILGSPNGFLTFTYYTGRTYELFIDVGPASPITPINDSYTYNVICPVEGISTTGETATCLTNMEFIVRYDQRKGKCPGGHTCNYATFLLKANNVTVGTAYLDNANGPNDKKNYPPGETSGANRYNSFTLTNQQVQDISNASQNGVIQLALVCNTPGGCHESVTWITVKVNGTQIYDGCPRGNFVKINACNGQVIP